MAVPAVAALALGLWGIDRQNSMWRDESVTYQVAHRSLGDLWGLLGHIDAVHGLYYLLMHAVFAVWDGGLVTLRLPSTVATALAAAGVGAIGTRLADRRTGLLAGLVFALLPVTQQYAQEGRSYALVTAGVTWATYLFLRAMDADRRAWWVAYAGTLGLACWLHEFAVLALVAHALTLWRLRPSGRVWRRWGIASAAVLVCLLPLVVVSAGQAEQQLGWLGRPSLAMWAQFVLLAGVGLLFCRFLPGRSGDTDSGDALSGDGTTLKSLALPILVAPAGLLMTGSLVKPWYVDRYVIYGMTGLALLAGAVLSRTIGQRHRLTLPARVLTACLLAGASVAVLLPWSLLIRSPESRKDDVVAVAHTVEKVTRPGDAVLFMPARRREWLLSYPSVYDRLKDLALAESPAASRTLQGTELPAGTIRRHILAADRVIALTDPAGQPLDPFAQEAVKREVLREHFVVCSRTPVRGAQVVVYARAGHCAD
ncbi:glycosyltransferase family 39 protein [Streptomyces mirabilis]|uniref:glycosyltransferase family 39 protein n=1 Tax=Streptomyces mirabilis TaxID=68239 RepID=UPI0021C1F886|nr:glycosyltransferase family 39 protein [Streptomyces mirabilis]MCT9104190.1 glycosyltransferase family 39 protein [Streptomyces mirabilis]